MDVIRRAEELSRRMGMPIGHMVARARADGLQGLFPFERLVDALLELEVRRGECAADQVDSRRHEIERILTGLAREEPEAAAEKPDEGDAAPRR